MHRRRPRRCHEGLELRVAELRGSRQLQVAHTEEAQFGFQALNLGFKASASLMKQDSFHRLHPDRASSALWRCLRRRFHTFGGARNCLRPAQLAIVLKICRGHSCRGEASAIWPVVKLRRIASASDKPGWASAPRLRAPARRRQARCGKPRRLSSDVAAPTPDTLKICRHAPSERRCYFRRLHAVNPSDRCNDILERRCVVNVYDDSAPPHNDWRL